MCWWFLDTPFRSYSRVDLFVRLGVGFRHVRWDPAIPPSWFPHIEWIQFSTIPPSLMDVVEPFTNLRRVILGPGEWNPFPPPTATIHSTHHATAPNWRSVIVTIPLNEKICAELNMAASFLTQLIWFIEGARYVPHIPELHSRMLRSYTMYPDVTILHATLNYDLITLLRRLPHLQILHLYGCAPFQWRLGDLWRVAPPSSLRTIFIRPRTTYPDIHKSLSWLNHFYTDQSIIIATSELLSGGVDWSRCTIAPDCPTTLEIRKVPNLPNYTSGEFFCAATTIEVYCAIPPIDMRWLGHCPRLKTIRLHHREPFRWSPPGVTIHYVDGK